jgi:hypothetical protein
MTLSCVFVLQAITTWCARHLVVLPSQWAMRKQLFISGRLLKHRYKDVGHREQ